MKELRDMVQNVVEISHHISLSSASSLRLQGI